MTSERIKEIQQETAYPNSVSVQQALLKVWNECEQERVKNCSIPAISGALPVYPPHYATEVEKIIKRWDVNSDIPAMEKVAMQHMASEIFRIYLVCRRQ